MLDFSKLSQVVARLESCIAVKLFYRYKQRLYLTEAGRQLLDDFKDIEPYFDSASESAQDFCDSNHAITIHNIFVFNFTMMHPICQQLTGRCEAQKIPLCLLHPSQSTSCYLRLDQRLGQNSNPDTQTLI